MHDRIGPPEAGALPWSLSLASSGWAYTLSRPPLAAYPDPQSHKLTAFGRLLAPGPLLAAQVGWTGRGAVTVSLVARVAAARVSVPASNFRAFCLFDTAGMVGG